MPVNAITSPDGQLVVARLSGRIDDADLRAYCDTTALEVARADSFCALLLFDPSVDMSHLDATTINGIRAHRQEQLDSLKVRRRTGAAVIHASADAGLVMPLWNALAETDDGQRLDFRLFHEIGPALDWLGVPRAEGKALIMQLGT